MVMIKPTTAIDRHSARLLFVFRVPCAYPFTNVSRCAVLLVRSDCNGELRRIQRTLTRGIIALHPGREESLDGRHSIAKALPDEMEALKASACLLLGNLVESGAPGHTESKAAMSCPPHYLLESATPPLLDGGENSAPDGCR